MKRPASRGPTRRQLLLEHFLVGLGFFDGILAAFALLLWITGRAPIL